MRRILPALALLSLVAFSSQGQQTLPVFLSNLSIGNGNAVSVEATVVDGSGNIYLAGGFQGTVDFDPSAAGTANLVNSGPVGYRDGFIAKYNSRGNYQWALSIGTATPIDVVFSLAVDGSGNVYATGYFGAQTDFDPSPGNTVNLTPTGSADLFVAKYTSTGQYAWAFNIGGTSSNSGVDIGNDIVLDGNGDLYLTGGIGATTTVGVDFDPSAGSAILYGKGTNIATAQDAFVAKYTSAGAYVWGFVVGGTGTDVGESLALDGSGNLLVTGRDGSTSATNNDWDPSTNTVSLLSAGSNDIFLAKYNSNGAYQWAFNVGSTAADNGYSTAVDGSGNVYVTGSFTGTVDFDPSGAVASFSAVGGSSNDAFLAKYNSSGAYLWAFNMGSSAAADQGNDVAVDADNNVLVVGTIAGSADFDPSAATQTLGGAGSDDAFLAKYSTAGAYVWAVAVASTGPDRGLALATSTYNRAVYVTGFIGTAADFDPSSNTASRTPDAASELYLASYFDGTVWKGSTSTAWATASNWNTGVPDAAKLIYIPGVDVTNMPTVSGTGNAAKSVIVRSGATLTLPGTLTVTDSLGNDGTLTATGTLVGKLANGTGGTASLGSGAIGTLTVTGTYFNRTGSTLKMRIAGTGGAGAATGNDKLAVSGTATLGGTLTVTFETGFAPHSGQTFTLVTAGTLAGTFASVQLPVGITGSVNYTSTAATLSISSVLPAELLAFAARRSEERIRCDWEVGSEQGLAGYGVERSFDGAAFTQVTWVPASGQKSYSAADDVLPQSTSTVWYRLRLLDVSGSYAYSPVAAVSLPQSLPKGILFPNPAHNWCYVSFPAVQVSLLDATGRPMRQVDLHGASGFSTAGLPEGLYHVRILDSRNRVDHQTLFIR